MPGAKDIDAEAHPPAPQTGSFPLIEARQEAWDETQCEKDLSGTTFEQYSLM